MLFVVTLLLKSIIQLRFRRSTSITRKFIILQSLINKIIKRFAAEYSWGSASYLDVLACRMERGLETDFYCKSIDTNQYQQKRLEQY